MPISHFSPPSLIVADHLRVKRDGPRGEVDPSDYCREHVKGSVLINRDDEESFFDTRKQTCFDAVTKRAELTLCLHLRCLRLLLNVQVRSLRERLRKWIDLV